MPTFILILTIWTGYGPSASVAMQQVPGFQSKQACLTAGDAWIKNTVEVSNFGIVRAVCVADR